MQNQPPSPDAKSANGKSTDHSPNVRGALATLEARLARLEKAHDQNHEVYADSFNVTEALIQVWQRAFNDFMNGSLRMVEFRPDGDGPTRYLVDFHSYLSEYYACMVFGEFAASLKALIPVYDAVVLTTPEEDAPLVFGD